MSRARGWEEQWTEPDSWQAWWAATGPNLSHSPETFWKGNLVKGKALQSQVDWGSNCILNFTAWGWGGEDIWVEKNVVCLLIDEIFLIPRSRRGFLLSCLIFFLLPKWPRATKKKKKKSYFYFLFLVHLPHFFFSLYFPHHYSLVFSCIPACSVWHWRCFWTEVKKETFWA